MVVAAMEFAWIGALGIFAEHDSALVDILFLNRSRAAIVGTIAR